MTDDTLDLNNFKGDCNLADVWDRLKSPILHVMDEMGVNVGNAVVRHFYDDAWIYVDNTDGYDLVREAEVQGWYLAEDDAGYGYRPDGSVVDAAGEVVYSPKD